jgi:ankyrin repeat protein
MYYLEILLKPDDEKEKMSLQFVKDLVNDGVDVNYCNSDQNNALFLAIKLESEELVKYLLEMNANIKQINEDGYSVFHMVSRNENSEVLRILAQKFDGTLTASLALFYVFFLSKRILWKSL